MPRSTPIAVLLLVVAGLLGAGDAFAKQASGRSPLELAQAVERRAAAASFQDLERFGQDALSRNDREGLQRLYHVVWTFMNQGEFKTAQLWNDRLAAAARHQRDGRYIRIADLNRLALRYDMGDRAAAAEMREHAAIEPDWFARTHAIRLWAVALMDQDEIGQGLKALADADALIPDEAPYARAARASLWEMTGIGLMQLNDIDGATAAFGHFEIDLANPDYPRPDFDAIYNLAYLSAQLGDIDRAKSLYEIHHRLTVRSGLPNLAVYDAALCAQTFEAANDPGGVLQCLAPLGENLGQASFLASQLLPSRAVARAQTGQIEAARRDLVQIRRRAAEESQREAASEIDHVEAEILFAEGRASEAFVKLRRHMQEDRVADARRFSDGIRQVTGDMQQQLTERRAQLETARSNTHLQGVLLAISVIFVLSALAAVLWMASQAKDLKVARRRAEEASRAKSEFLANMSHEIRTPLNGVVAMADALTRARLAPREREMVEVIRSSGVTLERLLSDILDSAKIEAGQIALERSVFDLGEAVRGVAALYRPSADQKGVALRLEVGPAAEGPVEGDLVRLRQVLSNLISNALKFTETGSVTVTASAVDAERMRFAVKDTGCGFDEEQKARIFGRFQQADGSITRRFGGTGLGLSISRDLVELMGGGLECRSRPGEGAEFWFELPLARVKASASAPAETARSDDFPFPARVLLADDHPANRKVIEIMLAETPAELVVVEDGRQALEAVRREPFDLVLMDMQMPVMDGLTATAAIRALERQDNRKRTPIIMLTANAMPEHVEAGRAAGADGHLSKPITFAGLIDGLSAVMGSAERSHAPAAA